MEKFNVDTLPEYFQFVMGESDDSTVFHATFPPNEYGFRNNNRVYVGWIKDGKPKSTVYLVNHVTDLVNCGSWKVLK